MTPSATDDGDRAAAPKGDELFNVVDAARVLSIRPWTLRHWISDGKIEIVKYGNGIVRIRRSVLDRFVRRCTIKVRERHGDRRTKKSRLFEGAGVGRDDESLAR
jgi:excisionase family DNA binding protein